MTILAYCKLPNPTQSPNPITQPNDPIQRPNPITQPSLFLDILLVFGKINCYLQTVITILRVLSSNTELNWTFPELNETIQWYTCIFYSMLLVKGQNLIYMQSYQQRYKVLFLLPILWVITYCFSCSGHFLLENIYHFDKLYSWVQRELYI